MTGRDRPAEGGPGAHSGHRAGVGVTPGQRPTGDVRAPLRDAAPWRSAALTARGPVAVTGPGTCTGGLPAWAWGLPQHPGPSLLRAAPRLLGAVSAVGSGRCQTRPAQHRGPLQPHTASQNIVTEKLNGRTVRLSRSTPSCLRGGERERPHTRPRHPHTRPRHPHTWPRVLRGVTLGRERGTRLACALTGGRATKTRSTRATEDDPAIDGTDLRHVPRPGRTLTA